MKPTDFNKIVKERHRKTTATLVEKGEEYSRNGDRLHNFHRAALMNGETPEKALWGMFAKHLISIMDMIEDTEKGKYPSCEMIDEKLGDAHNYLYLLEALFLEDAF